MKVRMLIAVDVDEKLAPQGEMLLPKEVASKAAQEAITGVHHPYWINSVKILKTTVRR